MRYISPQEIYKRLGNQIEKKRLEVARSEEEEAEFEAYLEQSSSAEEEVEEEEADEEGREESLSNQRIWRWYLVVEGNSDGLDLCVRI